MKKLILVIFLITIAGTGFSQAPGYLGKKILISGGIAPASSLLWGIEFTDDSYSLFLNMYEMNVDYVISRKNCIGIIAGFGNNKINPYYSFYTNNNNYNIHSFSSKTIRFGISFTHQRGNFISPVGKYIRYFVNVNYKSSEDFLLDQMANLNKEFGVGYYDDIIKKGRLFGLGLDNGYRYFIGKSFMIDFGLSLDFIAGYRLLKVEFSSWENWEAETIKNDLYQKLIADNYDQFFAIYFKLGFLL